MRVKVLLTLCALIALSFSSVEASGIPAAAIMNDPDFPVLIVLKFGSGFTRSDADRGSQLLSQALGLAGDFTTAAQSVQFLSPATLAQMGVTDADVLKNSARAPAEQLGYIYLFLDISKKDSAGGAQYGLSQKVDIWVSNDSSMALFAGALRVTGPFLYVATVEYPEMYPQLLFQMLSAF